MAMKRYKDQFPDTRCFRAQNFLFFELKYLEDEKRWQGYDQSLRLDQTSQ